MNATTAPIGPAIRKAREAAGLSKEELAEKINVKPGTVWNWENDVYLLPKTVDKISAGIGKRVEDYLPRPWSIYLVAILISSAAIAVGFYFWLQVFSVSGSISQSDTPEKFATFYDTLPEWMKKERATSLALYQALSPNEQNQLPDALKNYIDYEMRQAASRGQTEIAEGFGCKDKNFLKPGPVPCGYENYLPTTPRGANKNFPLIKGD